MPLLDTSRHDKFIATHKWTEPIHVIGCGATGSKIALSLAKLGLGKWLNLYDADIVEKHNIPNQIFDQNDVGKNKAEQTAKRIDAVDVNAYPKVDEEMITSESKYLQNGGIVLLLTDTMNSRKEIFDNLVKMKFNIPLMIETRMGPDSFMIYTINPCNPIEIEAWTQTLYTDDEAEASACGTVASVGPTGDIISGLVCWQLMQWFAGEQIFSEILGAVNPPMLVTANLERSTK
jgi:sulfur carrier protein ThiS adenylyltransferase